MQSIGQGIIFNCYIMSPHIPTNVLIISLMQIIDGLCLNITKRGIFVVYGSYWIYGGRGSEIAIKLNILTRLGQNMVLLLLGGTSQELYL